MNTYEYTQNECKFYTHERVYRERERVRECVVQELYQEVCPDSSVQGHLTSSAADVGVFAVRRVLRDPTAVQAVLVSPVRSLTETSDKVP